MSWGYKFVLKVSKLAKRVIMVLCLQIEKCALHLESRVYTVDSAQCLIYSVPFSHLQMFTLLLRVSTSVHQVVCSSHKYGREKACLLSLPYSLTSERSDHLSVYSYITLFYMLCQVRGYGTNVTSPADKNSVICYSERSVGL